MYSNVSSRQNQAMCCFSRPVRGVSSTSIFARPLADGWQSLAYAMRYAAAEPLALVLPLPVPDDAGEDAVSWIDLHQAPRLFDQLARGFGDAPPEVSRSAATRPPNLAVVKVGAFEASFAPTASDLDRLDPRFTLPRTVLESLPGLAGRGFVVARLHPEATTIHPLGFTFRRRDPGRVFFPTLHVHDGKVHPHARFDHRLYLQSAASPPASPSTGWLERLTPGGPRADAWQPMRKPLHDVLDTRATGGLVAPDLPVYRRVLSGRFRNEDVLV